MIKISITEYKINSFGEIEKGVPAKTTFERLDLNSFEELFYFEKMINGRNIVDIKYENGKRYISIVGKDFRRYIKII